MFSDIAPGQIAMIYSIAAVLWLGILFYRHKFKRKTGMIFLFLSIASGFLLFAPMLPLQMQGFISGRLQAAGHAPGKLAVGLGIFLIFTLIAGRVFCGYVCPIGALQEILYLIRSKKIKTQNHIAPLIFRLLFFIAMIASAALFSAELLSFTGVKQFFKLEYTSLYFYVFLFLMILSVFLYRVFCRFLCPFGLLLSLSSFKSLFKIQRNTNCNNCTICEKACPTGETVPRSLGMECYMCNKCIDVCRVSGIDYDKY
ncbi:MAG: hypothetical protein A2096_05790 [Spirochaetes bacterium GWF1_41_5]|nr:MAG: hypothetical protein A2096_05790 [Spirochaetes bacterium GWF1_41_5]HBE03641.1 4Fe-4S ferredoxin [Spirochaetia bacterium]